MVNHMIPGNPNKPCNEDPRVGPIRCQRPINLEKYLLSQVFSLLEFSGEAVGDIEDSSVVLADDRFPSIAISLEAGLHQFRIGGFQLSSSATHNKMNGIAGIKVSRIWNLSEI